MTRDVALQRLAWLATALAFVVIVFGAFVRLSNAGLSCPDWPTCYGKATWPEQPHDIARADARFPDRPVETHKTWREQVHRMLAGSLGILVLALALLVTWPRRNLRLAIIGAAVAAAIGVGLYIAHEHVASSVFAAIAIELPLVVAARLDFATPLRIAVATLAVVILQAMLGMWTVTLLLKPIVVMGHLLGGMTTFGLLAYTALSLSRDGPPLTLAAYRLKPFVVATLVILACQIALGGWTSSNYAALACGFDFPKCLGQWWPPTDFHQGFVLWRQIGVNYEGGVLDLAARSAIQMTHRIGALIVFASVLGLVALLWRRGLRGFACVLCVLLCAQLALGIGNVKLGLPLAVATAHNAGAALLLFTLIALLVRLQPMPASPEAAAEGEGSVARASPPSRRAE
ncbi:MAG: COX15/CtaA family protein [Rhodanobacteraceae bacterium]